MAIGADGDRDEAVRGIAQLAQAAGAVADRDEHQRGDAERLQQRGVDEQADPEAEQRARDRAHQQADRRDEQRREVGGHAEDGDLRDRGQLQDAPEQAERGEAGDDGGGRGRGVGD